MEIIFHVTKDRGIINDSSILFSFELMRNAFFILFLLFSTGIFGQSFTQTLQEKRPGQGSVKIFQDDAIDDLVNGNVKKDFSKSEKLVNTKTHNEKRIADQSDESISLGDDVVIAPKNRTYKKSYSATGFRIQIFSGDDSRNSRQRAYAMGSKFKSYFPTLPVYTHFFSPHWICRVGDFRTYEEANGYLHQLHEIGGFKESAIIKCRIQVGY